MAQHWFQKPQAIMFTLLLLLVLTFAVACQAAATPSALTATPTPTPIAEATPSPAPATKPLKPEDSGTSAATAALTTTGTLRTLRSSHTDGQQVHLSLSPDKAVNPIGASHTVTVKVLVDDKLAEGAKVTFTVISGPHAGMTFETTTDADGIATFTYTGTIAGEDIIEATAAAGGAIWTSNQVTKAWKAAAPTTKELYTYPVKFVCGSIPGSGDMPAIKEPPVKPGNYATAINILNIFDEAVKLTYWASVAAPVSAATPPGPVSTEIGMGLRPRQAMEIDCPQIMGLFGGIEVARADFLKGFLVIESTVDLQVVAVYTSEKLEVRHAGTPIGINLNTGFDQSADSEIAYSAPDDDWDVVDWVAVTNSPPIPSRPFDAVVVSQQVASSRWGGPVPGSRSRWISTDNRARLGVKVGEVFTYAYEFTLPAGVECPTLEMTLMADQEAEVFLNGNSIGLVPSWPASSPSGIMLTTSNPNNFQSGSNTLTVVVKETVGVVTGFDAVGTVRANSCPGVGTGMSIDVEYIQPKISRRVKPPNGDKPDLAIEKSQESGFPFGGTGTYLINIKNVGAGTASAPITVVDTLPFGFTSIAGSANSPWSCIVINPVTNPATDQETVECTYPGTLAPGDSLTLVFEVNVNPVAARPPGPNCVEVRHPDDTNTSNNTSCVETVLVEPAEEGEPTGSGGAAGGGGAGGG